MVNRYEACEGRADFFNKLRDTLDKFEADEGYMRVVVIGLKPEQGSDDGIHLASTHNFGDEMSMLLALNHLTAICMSASEEESITEH